MDKTAASFRLRFGGPGFETEQFLYIEFQILMHCVLPVTKVLNDVIVKFVQISDFFKLNLIGFFFFSHIICRHDRT